MDFLFFSVCVPVSLITTPSNCPLLGKNLLPGPLTPCCQISAPLFQVARSRPAYSLLPDPGPLISCCQIPARLLPAARSPPPYSKLPDPSPLIPCCHIPARLLPVARSRPAYSLLPDPGPLTPVPRSRSLPISGSRRGPSGILTKKICFWRTQFCYHNPGIQNKLEKCVQKVNHFIVYI